MPVLQLAGKQIALGLQWSFLADRAELRRVLKHEARLGYVTADCDDGLLCGIQAEAIPGRAPTYAGGLLVGQLLRDAIVYQELGNGRFWVCAVRDGLPLPGVDRVCGVGEAERLVQDVLIHARRQDIPLIGSQPQANQSLVDLLEQVEPVMLRAARLRQPLARTQQALYGCMAVCVLLTLLIGWNILQREEPVVAPVLQNIGVQGDRAALERAYQAELQRLVEAERARLLERPTFAGAKDAWVRKLRELPFAVGGYKPRLLSCSAQSCRADWDWQANLFDRGDLKRLPGRLLPVGSPMEYATRAQTEFDFDVPKQRLQPLPAEQVDDYVLGLGSRLQKLGARAEISRADQPVSIGVPATADDWQARQRDAKFATRQQLIGQQGNVRLMVGGWARVWAVLDSLAEQPLVPERAIFTLNNGSVSLQLEARYVVLAD